MRNNLARDTAPLYKPGNGNLENRFANQRCGFKHMGPVDPRPPREIADGSAAIAKTGASQGEILRIPVQTVCRQTRKVFRRNTTSNQLCCGAGVPTKPKKAPAAGRAQSTLHHRKESTNPQSEDEPPLSLPGYLHGHNIQQPVELHQELASCIARAQRAGCRPCPTLLGRHWPLLGSEFRS